jgi:hypothetical protein
MPAKRINPERTQTNAERQKRYREKRRAAIAELEALKAAQTPAEAPYTQDIASLREEIKAELRKSWEPELKAERIAAERKRGRELAKKADQSHAQGRIGGICSAASFLAGKGRDDIARAILSHFMIGRDTAASALEADKRTKSLALETLDKAKAWDPPPEVIK